MWTRGKPMVQKPWVFPWQIPPLELSWSLVVHQVNQFQLVIFVFCFCTVDDRSLEVRCVPRNLNIDSRRVSDQSRGPMLLSIYKKVNPDPDPHWLWSDGSRSRRAKRMKKNWIKWRNSMFWSAGYSLLRAGGFSWSLDILYWDLGIKIEFLM